MSVYWIPILAIFGSFGIVIILAYLGAQTRQRLAQHRADVQLKLIDRFGTANEFVSFVKSDDGRRFLGDAPKTARKGALYGVRFGIVSTFMGLAFVLCSITQNDRDWLIPAFILLAIGGGFIVAALLSMKLARDIDRSDPNEVS